MKRTEIINRLVDKFNYKSYLEIGIGQGTNFEEINCEYKECCDPHPFDDCVCMDKVTYRMTSDEMFEIMDYNKKFDIIFIDGLHSAEQVLRDLWNSFNHITEHGSILIHDSLPIAKEFAMYPFPGEVIDKLWYGDVYRIYPILVNEGMKFNIFEDDCGIGFIRGDQRFKSVNVPQASKLTFDEIFTNSNYNFPKIFNLIWSYEYFGL